MEERLRQERDRLELITTTIGAGLSIISRKYQILWANQVFIETFGDYQGQPCFKAYSHSERHTFCYDCGARQVFEKGRDKTIHEQQINDLSVVTQTTLNLIKHTIPSRIAVSKISGARVKYGSCSRHC